MAFSGMNSYNEQRRRNANIDNYSDKEIVIDYAHHEIHEGDMFHLDGWNDLPSNNFIDIRITTPNSPKWMNFVGTISGEAEFTFWMYEGVAILNAGTTLNIWNANRNKTNVSLSSWDYIINTTEANANLDTDITSAVLLPTGKGGSGRDAGGVRTRDAEIILKQNTIYLIRMRNDDGTSTRWVDYEFNWYEHAQSL